MTETTIYRGVRYIGRDPWYPVPVSIAELVTRTGEELGADVVVVRLLAGDHLDAVGSTRPVPARVTLAAAAVARVSAWIDAGEATRAHGPLGRELLDGIGTLGEREWLLVPLAGGVMVVGSARPLELDRRAVAGI